MDKKRTNKTFKIDCKIKPINRDKSWQNNESNKKNSIEMEKKIKNCLIGVSVERSMKARWQIWSVALPVRRSFRTGAMRSMRMPSTAHNKRSCALSGSVEENQWDKILRARLTAQAH